MSEPMYEMKLNETVNLGGPDAIRIYRVPGGWIYNFAIENGTGGYDMTACFVPFHNEFQSSFDPAVGF